MSFRRSDVVPSPEQLYTGTPETADLDAAKNGMRISNEWAYGVTGNLYHLSKK